MSGIAVKELGVHLGGRQILQDISFAARPGELVGLVGPNGAGKTTLLRAIQGLVPSKGTVDLDPAQIGYVPQRREFAWDFPIDVTGVVLSGLTRQIGWGRRAKSQHFRAVLEALERVELRALSRRSVGELSGGQRQRVLVARALAGCPSVLLLDEPFTGLDLPSAELLLGLFRRLADSGTTILMSTHDLAGAVQKCDKLLLLKGRIVAYDSPQGMRDRQLWKEAFEVTDDSPLYRLVGCK